jgi:hypothetical protein
LKLRLRNMPDTRFSTPGLSRIHATKVCFIGDILPLPYGFCIYITNWARRR